MFSITLRRSAATLGVVLAGLLAPAGPASAQIGPATIGVKAPRANSSEVAMESVTQARSHNDGFIEWSGGPDVFVHASARTSSLQDCMVSGYNVKVDAEGTQVGSEGVKAPSKADNRSKHELEDCMVSGFTFGQGAIPLL